MSRRVVIATLFLSAASLVPASHVAAQPDREVFSVDMLVTSVVPGEERTIPNDKWTFFEDKYVTTEGVGWIGATEYAASLDASVWGKLGPDGTDGAEWGAITLSLADGTADLECEGVFHVQRFVDERYPDTSPVPYGESGMFRVECDDGVSAMGDFLGTFGDLDGVPGFVVSMDGVAR
jgi:hypothetical protein